MHCSLHDVNISHPQANEEKKTSQDPWSLLSFIFTTDSNVDFKKTITSFADVSTNIYPLAELPQTNSFFIWEGLLKKANTMENFAETVEKVIYSEVLFNG